MKQTAVEWLIDKLDIVLPLTFEWDKLEKIFEQAKAMEKEQSKTDYETGQASTKFKFPLPAEQYYQETYGK